jgi:hypothetical protein
MLATPCSRPARIVLCTYDVPSSCHAGEKTVPCVWAPGSYASWAAVEKLACGSEEGWRSCRFDSLGLPLACLRRRRDVVIECRSAPEPWAGCTSSDSCKGAHESVPCTEGRLAARCSASVERLARSAPAEAAAVGCFFRQALLRVIYVRRVLCRAIGNLFVGDGSAPRLWSLSSIVNRIFGRHSRLLRSWSSDRSSTTRARLLAGIT